MKYEQGKLNEINEVEIINFNTHNKYFGINNIENYLEKYLINYKFKINNFNSIIDQNNYLRGMYYEVTKGSGRVIRLTKGEIFISLVDMRKRSITFSFARGIYLKETDFKAIYVPQGVAFGYYTISEKSEVLHYNSNDQKSEILLWNDKNISINWPIYEYYPICIFPDMSEEDKFGKNFINCSYYMY